MEAILFKTTLENRNYNGEWDFREDSQVCVDGKVHVKYRKSRSNQYPKAKIKIVETGLCDGTCRLAVELSAEVETVVTTFLGQKSSS